MGRGGRGQQQQQGGSRAQAGGGEGARARAAGGQAASGGGQGTGGVSAGSGRPGAVLSAAVRTITDAQGRYSAVHVHAGWILAGVRVTQPTRLIAARRPQITASQVCDHCLALAWRQWAGAGRACTPLAGGHLATSPPLEKSSRSSPAGITGARGGHTRGHGPGLCLGTCGHAEEAGRRGIARWACSRRRAPRSVLSGCVQAPGGTLVTDHRHTPANRHTSATAIARRAIACVGCGDVGCGGRQGVLMSLGAVSTCCCGAWQGARKLGKCCLLPSTFRDLAV